VTSESSQGLTLMNLRS